MAIDKEAMIQIKNLTKSRVVFSFQTAHGAPFKRIMNAKAIIPLKYEDFQVAMYMPGIEAMFREGILGVVGNPEILEQMEVNYDVKLATEIANKMDSIEKIFRGSSGDIFKFIRDSTKNSAVRDQAIDYVVTNKIYDSNIVKWMKEFYNYDLLAALKTLAQAEEPDKPSVE